MSVWLTEGLNWDIRNRFSSVSVACAKYLTDDTHSKSGYGARARLRAVEDAIKVMDVIKDILFFTLYYLKMLSFFALEIGSEQYYYESLDNEGSQCSSDQSAFNKKYLK